MHIVVLYQNYLAPGEAGMARYNEFARCWADAGHDVTVITGTIHYASGKKDPRYAGHWMVRESDGPGVTVIRTFMSEGYQSGFIWRLMSYGSFAMSALWAGLFAARKPDVIIAYSPPLFVGMSGWLLAQLRRSPWVLEVGDLWPEFAVQLGILRNAALIKLASWLEAFLYRRADWISVVTPAFRDNIAARFPETAGKLLMNPNAVDLDVFHPGPQQNWVRDEYGWSDRFVFLYAGTHGISHNLDRLLDLAASVRDSHPQILIALVGDGMAKPALQARARAEQLDNVQFVDMQPRHLTKDFCNAADVCVSILQKIEAFKLVHPGKLFDYLSCGRPVFVAIDGSARELIEEAGAGLHADPEDAAAMRATALRFFADPELCAHFAQSARTFVQTHYQRQELADRFVRAIHP